jgi:O-antigen ligase
MQSELVTRRYAAEYLPFAIAALAVLVTASLFYTPGPFLVLAAIPCCIYFARRPYELLLFMTFLIPFNFIFTVGPVPVAAELLKVIAWIPLVATRRERHGFVSSRYNKLFLVLGGLFVLSLFRARDLPFTLKEVVRQGSNLGLVYLCLNLVDSKEKVLQVLRVLTVSSFLVACYGFYQWAIQDFGALFWLVNPRLDTGFAHYRDQFWEWRNRIISVLTSEMELGHYFNLCIPIGVMLWITEGRQRLGSKWLLMSVCMIAGLVLTFTFGAWAALAATFGFFAFLLGKGKRAKIFIGGLLILVLIAAFVAYGPLRTVVEQKAVGDSIGSFAWDAATRLYGWKIALQTWWAHTLIGAGVGNFEILSADYDVVLGAQSQGSTPHQTYFYLLANVGLVGLASVLTIVIGTIRRNVAIMRSKCGLSLIALALAFGLTTNLLGWFSDDSGFLGPHAGYLFWLLVGLSEGVARFARLADNPLLQPDTALL